MSVTPACRLVCKGTTQIPVYHSVRLASLLVHGGTKRMQARNRWCAGQQQICLSAALKQHLWAVMWTQAQPVEEAEPPTPGVAPVAPWLDFSSVARAVQPVLAASAAECDRVALLCGLCQVC